MSRLIELRTALLDLLHATQGTKLRIIVGGGYGIYLKREYVKETSVRTVLDQLPQARATNDLDLFLRPELLIESEELKPLAEAITKLGYQVVEHHKYWQFIRNPEGPSTIKVDLLTGPRASFKGTAVKADARRAKPKTSVGIHARPVDEALSLADGAREFKIGGRISAGEDFNSSVSVPHPFTYLMMKLFAFRDRLEDPTRDNGSYHALDLYTIMATTTAEEWDGAVELSKKNKDQDAFHEATTIVSTHFTAPTGLGIIRLKEGKYFEERLQVREFMDALRELFPPLT